MRTLEDIYEAAGTRDQTQIMIAQAASFGYFMRVIRGFEFTEFHNRIYRRWHNNRFSRVMMARQHGKTTLAVSYLLWLAFNKQNLDILVVSSTLDQSIKFLERVKDGITDNVLLRTLKPSQENIMGRGAAVSDFKWSASEIWTTTKVKIFNRPFGSSIRGLSPNIVICDDILRNDDGAMSDDKAIELYNSDIMPTVNTTRGKVIVIGTPISFTDLLSTLTEKQGYATLTLPAIKVDENRKWIRSLWDTHFTLQDWKDELHRIGTYSFEKEYMCSPLSASDSWFPESMIKPQMTCKYKNIRNPEHQYYIGSDIALSKSSTADYTVHYVIERDDEGFLHTAYKEKYRGRDTSRIITDYKRLQKQWRFSHGLVENNAISYGLVQEIQKTPELMTISGFTTTRQSKERILSQLQASFLRGELHIADDPELIKELGAFGIKKVRGVEKIEGLGKHDDEVMALAIALEAALNGTDLLTSAEYV